jgi:hypothetical protein
MPVSRRPFSLGWGGIAVVGTGLFEVGVRLLPETLNVAFGKTLAAVLASVTVNLSIQNSILLSVAQALFLLVTFYFFLPTVLPGAAGDRARQNDPFRVILASIATLFAIPVVLLATGAWTAIGGTGGLFVTYLFSTVVVAVFLVIALLSLTQAEPLLEPESDAYAVIRARRDETADVIRAEFGQLDDGPRWFGHLVRFLAVGAVAASYIIPMILLGVIGGALNAVFPVLELLVLFGLIWEARQDESTDAEHLELSELTDVDQTFYEQLSMATRGMTGAAATLVCVLGVLTPVAAVALVLSSGYLTPAYVVSDWGLAIDYLVRSVTGTVSIGAVGEQFVSAGSQTGEFLALPIAIGYATWFWYREIQRLPGTVASMVPGSDSEGAEGPYPVRPPGMLLPAAGLVFAWKIELLHSIGDLRLGWLPVEPSMLFVVLWPPLVVVHLVTFRRTLSGQSSEQPDASWRVGIPLFVSFWSTLLIAYFIVMPIGRSILLATVGAVTVAWLFYYKRFARWAEANTQRADLLVSVYALSLTGIAIVGTVLEATPPVFLAVAAISAVLVLFRHVSPAPAEPQEAPTEDRDKPSNKASSTRDQEQ